MAERELSILVRAKGAIQAARDIGQVNKSVGGLGRTSAVTIAKGIGIERLAEGAVRATGRAIRGGLESLATLEDAESSVTGAIKQAGQSGQVSAKQISGWANDIEASVEAAFDDKDITNATATLIRFGKVTPSNIRPAMAVMTDLAVKTGDVDGAASLLAKALADPAKAAGKLARQGIILTKSQQDQIKAFVKAGDTASAQTVIIDELAKTTAGAAKASAGPYRDSLNILTDVTEDAQRALATGFLPVITKVRDLLSVELAKPETLANIKKFGEFLAGGLTSLIDTARGLPWDSIGAALHLGGMGAKAILDAFSAMPPWVQTAILTGWGLNKVTGGAVTGIIGELGKGLIKGVLGMNAGVVNINAGVVNGAGGGVPSVGPSGGGGGLLGTLKGLILPVAIASIAEGVAFNVVGIGDPQHKNPKTGEIFRGTNVAEDQIANLLGVQAQLQQRANGGDTFAARQLVSVTAEIERLRGETTAAANAGSQAAVRAAERQEALMTPQKLAIIAADAHETAAIRAAQAASATATAAAAAASRGTTQAIKDKDLSVTSIFSPTIVTNVSVKETIKSQTTFKKYQKFIS